MIFYILPLIVILLSCIGMGFIIVKKFPQLSLINVDSIAQEKEAKVRNRIILERLNRNLISVKNFLYDVFEPAWEELIKSVKDWYQKIIELEEKNLNPQPLAKIDINQKIKEKLAEVETLLGEQELDQAENVCVSIVELDPKNDEVYRCFTNIYLAQKEYKKARETCRYLLKLLTRGKVENMSGEDKHRLANCYADLGWIYQLERKLNYALANYQKAVDLEPSNPRFLDLFLKISIMLKNKKLAQEAFSGLKEADPDNQKLPELKAEIEALSDEPGIEIV